MYEEFHVYYLVIFAALVLMLFAYVQMSDRGDELNNFFAFFALAFVFINILIFLNLMFQITYFHRNVLPIWCLTLGLPILVIGLVVLISSILLFCYKLAFKQKDYKEREEKWNKRITGMSKTKRDVYRKISHVLIFIVLFVVWYIGYTVVINSEETWVGMIPTNNNTLELYINVLTTQEYIESGLFELGWFYYLIFFFFYGLCLFLLVNELTRKSKYLSFPFNLLPKLIMTEEEKRSYGTYLYFAIGQMFAAFLCPPMVFFAILGIAGIGDLMTSQIGIRYGKHHIKWNDRKTYEGTCAGTITCFILCWFFVGIIWSTIFTIVFTLIDVFTDKPLRISDNLLIPIGCALTYVFIRYFFDLDYITIIMEWF